MLLQLTVLALLHTLSAELVKPYYEVDNLVVVRQHFEEFITNYNRSYKIEEKIIRFNIFHETLRRINQLNKESETAIFAINDFADKSSEERMSYLGYIPSEYGSGNCQEIQDPWTNLAPDAWDWRNNYVVSPVKAQRACGSCWAFSAVALLESRYLAKGISLSLSEQQLVDCDTYSSGCKGGYPQNALTSIMNMGGIESEYTYPYEEANDQCRFDRSKVVANLASCRVYSLSNEEKLKELLYEEGPLSIIIYTNKLAWHDYHGGVFDKCEAGPGNHVVLLVGYGTEKGKDYWVIKNSWGTNYGEQGFIRIARGRNCVSFVGQRSNIVSATV